MYPAKRNEAYDRAATMFSPDGRLYQVEYASKIVEQGTLGIGLVYDKGVVLIAHKKPSWKIMVPKTIEKLFKIDDYTGAISAGLIGDARRIVSFAREEAQNNKQMYDEQIQIEYLVKQISSIKQYYTQYAGVRPFGVSLIIGGYDSTGPRLFETEPSGAMAEYKAAALGKNSKEAMSFLDKNFSEGLAQHEALEFGLKAIKKSVTEKTDFDISYIDAAYISVDTPFTRISEQELQNLKL